MELEPQEARKLLGGVVPEPLLDAYCALLTRGGCPPQDADELLGGPVTVQALKDRGMVHEWTSPSRLMAATPDLALQGALIDLERRLREDHKQFMAGHQRLGETHRTRAVLGGHSDQFVEVITDREEIRNVSYGLINTARRDWMTLENLLFETPINEASCCPPVPVAEGTVSCRSVYEIAFMEQPGTAQIVEAAVAGGEKARLLPRVGMKMKLADDTVAMLPLTPTGMEGALLVRSPVILGALRQYFEMLWETATPIGVVAEPDERAGLTEAQARVLRLLVQGLQDESIAHRLHVSVQTVRRHITDMRERLGVETRFAMGVAALRRGWIE